jgi:hypothetical protein
MVEPAGVHHSIKHDRAPPSAKIFQISVMASQVRGTKRSGPLVKSRRGAKGSMKPLTFGRAYPYGTRKDRAVWKTESQS